MQKFNFYSIFDVKAQTYGAPFTALNDSLALRVVAEIVTYSGNTDYKRYPQDFSIFCLGDFVDNTGAIGSCTPRLVSTLTAVFDALRGAAVGGEAPLKSQSATLSDSADAADKSLPACDAESESTVTDEVKNA